MAQAAVLSITGDRSNKSEKGASDRSARDAKLADAFRDMEGKLHDLTLMMELATTAVEDFINESHQRDTGRNADKTLFGVYHVQKMLRDLLSDWTAGFTDK
jgi:hypothetical protein